MLVKPRDVIVADGDGDIVMPRPKADAVASSARKILEGDKATRRGLYQKLGLPEESVEEMSALSRGADVGGRGDGLP